MGGQRKDREEGALPMEVDAQLDALDERVELL